jgi:tRNA pseudouridine38-40 synthase
VAGHLTRYLATVSYHGAHFAGWQVQKNQQGVQAVLEAVLTQLHKQGVRIVGSGRTDAGVHALAQTFHFDSDLKLSEPQWLKAINAQLPAAISVLDVKAVASDFHARFDVQSKRYRYKLSFDPLTPFNFQTHHHEPRPIDLDALESGLRLFLGTHDFTSLNATPLKIQPHQVRTIRNVALEPQTKGVDVIVEGDGFLRYMVRMMVALALDVGTHTLSLETAQAILEQRDKRAYSGKVPASGLYLEAVIYA